MTDKDIRNALFQRLQTAANSISTIPAIVWPDKDPATPERPAAPAPPYWIAEVLFTPPARFGLTSTSLQSSRMIVDIMDTPNQFGNPALAHAEAIKAQFPINLSLTVPTGNLTIVDPAYADEGYRDGPYWRTKVHVRWQAIR
jgi:hypothetical protein